MPTCTRGDGVRSVASNWTLLGVLQKMHAGWQRCSAPRIFTSQRWSRTEPDQLRTTTLVDWCHRHPTPPTDAAIDALRESASARHFFGTPKPDPSRAKGILRKLLIRAAELERGQKHRVGALIGVGRITWPSILHDGSRAP